MPEITPVVSSWRKRELDGIGQGHEVIHAQDMEAEAQGTEDGQRVPTGKLQGAVDAQEVEPHCGHYHAAPNFRWNTLMQKQAEHRHQDDVHGGDEPGLAHGSVSQPHLLEGGGEGHHDAAGQTALEQGLLFRLGHLAIGACLLLAAVRDQDDRHQGQRTQEVTAGLGSERRRGRRLIPSPRAPGPTNPRPPDDGGQQTGRRWRTVSS